MLLQRLGHLALFKEEYESANTLFNRALSIYREMGAKSMTADALQDLALTARRMDDHASCYSRYREALKIWQCLNHQVGLAQSLEGLAGLAAVQHKAVQAARLLGAAEALRETNKAPLQRYYRSQYKRERMSILTQLDETAFEQARKEGRAMRLDQVVV